mmetsp:Transcript_63952/g.101425  ORF Transcript_63952/g.101425 Transcript_63952/m.101425 type:complete len:134 (+) Transcript_63952:61-462(+)
MLVSSFAFLAWLLLADLLGASCNVLRSSHLKHEALSIVDVMSVDSNHTEANPEYDDKAYNSKKYPGWRKEYPYNKTKERQPDYPENSEGLQHHPDYSEKWEEKKPPAKATPKSSAVEPRAILAVILTGITSIW